MNFSLKIMGCGLIVIASTLIGFLLAQRLKNRCDFLTAIMEFLCNLKTNIRYSGEDIFGLIEKSVNKTLSEYFYSSNNGSMEEYWSDCIKKVPHSYGLQIDDYNTLKDFGLNLGKTDIEGQTSHIELYSNLFLNQLEKAKAEYNTKSKLYKLLGFFVGCAIALMII